MDKVFKPFIEEKPICVMARAVLQRILDPRHLDQLSARTAQRQYAHEFLFSSLIDRMTRIVLGQEPFIHAAYRPLHDQLPFAAEELGEVAEGVAAEQLVFILTNQRRSERRRHASKEKMSGIS